MQPKPQAKLGVALMNFTFQILNTIVLGTPLYFINTFQKDRTK